MVHENLCHVCKDCSFKAIRMSTLKLHMESIHEKFKCDQWSYESCNKSYVGVGLEANSTLLTVKIATF